MAKAVEINENGWTLVGGAPTVGSGLDGVSINDPGTQRERIFYISSGIFKMGSMDAGGAVTFSNLTMSGLTASGNDLAQIDRRNVRHEHAQRRPDRDE